MYFENKQSKIYTFISISHMAFMSYGYTDIPRYTVLHKVGWLDEIIV